MRLIKTTDCHLERAGAYPGKFFININKED